MLVHFLGFKSIHKIERYKITKMIMGSKDFNRNNRVTNSKTYFIIDNL